ncbi:MAG TPA: VOC family protein [Candidatus Dormibacteraeota bacterium]|nr:VOC family protein [Candidatus Dormibacteraeota bacterium]
MSGTELTTPTGVAPRERSDRPIDAGVDIGHVHLKTADIDRVHHFYVDILGFDVVFRRPDALFLSAGGYHHHLGFNTWESKGGNSPPPGTTGLYHVAIRYPTRAALGDALRRLVAADWPLDGVNDHGTHEALYLSDPDGNGLELAWDRPESQWPKDADGHLTFSGRRLDLEGLIREGVDAQASMRRAPENSEA